MYAGLPCPTLDTFVCSVRRNVDNLKESLEKVVVPIFCTARMGCEEEKQQDKLNKVNCIHSPQNFIALNNVFFSDIYMYLFTISQDMQVHHFIYVHYKLMNLLFSFS